MIITLDQLFGYGSHFTDILHTSGRDGTPQHQYNQCFHNTSASFFLQNHYLHPRFKIRYNFEISREKYVLYYDPTVEYNTKECSYSYLCFGNIPTVLLILCPTRLFRRRVSCCGFRSWHMLCTCLWNHFKDSTRMEEMVLGISGWFLHHSLSWILTMATFANRHYSYHTSSRLQCLSFASAVCFYTVVRPYKLNFRNNVEIFILFMLGVLLGMLLYATFHPTTKAPFRPFQLLFLLLVRVFHSIDVGGGYLAA